ncbi:hypothetical protein B0H16DRAFT_1470016 [Mycena metata]|uniref:Uncharacterized protein n=1 Tax=Mycena metata TaxID=1033252 RepID=A0AAD7HVT1_9AGAR|nr:hypothetical protein B0H16DRAFT_1470016 [Mycena metata]
MYLQAKGNKKGSKKGWKKGAPSGGFTVALFLALFALVPLLHLVSFIATRGKKPGGKRKKWEKGRKKGVKKGEKRATVNDPNIRAVLWLFGCLGDAILAVAWRTIVRSQLSKRPSIVFNPRYQYCAYVMALQEYNIINRYPNVLIRDVRVSWAGGGMQWKPLEVGGSSYPNEMDPLISIEICCNPVGMAEIIAQISPPILIEIQRDAAESTGNQ